MHRGSATFSVAMCGKVLAEHKIFKLLFLFTDVSPLTVSSQALSPSNSTVEVFEQLELDFFWWQETEHCLSLASHRPCLVTALTRSAVEVLNEPTCNAKQFRVSQISRTQRSCNPVSLVCLYSNLYRLGNILQLWVYLSLTTSYGEHPS